MAASASVERFLTRLLIRVVRRRRLLWLVCCAAVAGAVVLAVFAGNYGNDLGELFPPDSESGRTFRVMQKSGLINRVQLEFDTGDAGIEQAKLAPWLDRLAPRLAALPQVLTNPADTYYNVLGPMPIGLIGMLPMLAVAVWLTLQQMKREEKN